MSNTKHTPNSGLDSVFGRMTHRTAHPAPAAKTTPKTVRRKPAPPVTTTLATPASTPRTGRPRRYGERMSPVPVVLGTPQLAYLETAPLSRAEVIRAALDAMQTAGVDLATVSTEEALRDLLTERLHQE